MKKISQETIEQLKRVSVDELTNHGIIETAPDFKPYAGGYSGLVCPMCNSGKNRERGRATGAGTIDAKGKFYCHACENSDFQGHKLSTIDLFAMARNLTHETFIEQVKQMADEFGISIEYDNESDLPTTTAQQSKKSAPPKTAAQIKADEVKIIRQDLSGDDKPLKQFVDEHGGAWRGLPLEILLKHGVKYNSAWTPPTSRVAGKYATPTPRILIPSGNDSYLARLTIPIGDFDERTQKYIVEKQHAGRKALFNTDVLNSDKPVFCVEGCIDALSAEFAGFEVVALNGAGNGGILVTTIARKEKKPQIVILLDGDDTGRKAATKLRDDLISVGCACVIRFLSNENSKVDANQILTQGGVDNLRGILKKIFDDSLAELDAITLKLEKEKFLNADFINSLFEGDATDSDYARRFGKFFGDRVRWLTDTERWLIFKGGVWTRGSDRSTCLLPQVAELADVMEKYAESKIERELATRLKSSRKIAGAVTMMKGIERILITQDDLDKHPELLNCLNGVIDLQTSKLFPAEPHLLLTQACRADFNASARSELVEKFFRDIMPDEPTRAGLLRWLGYCLTGDVSAEKFAVWTGTGANGKGVLSATMLRLLGDYGAGLSPRALMKNLRTADANAATTSLNSLEHSRFAISEEIPADAELDASLIKNLTGGDLINLRQNYGEYREVEPTSKINISGNYLPRIENVADGGILRRLINFAFAVKFGTAEHPADVDLKKKLLLAENLRGLLAILVREAALWYRDGLIISDAMKEETARHLAQSDFISDFIADNYILHPDATVKTKDFIDALKKEYPRETSRFKRADLIKLIEAVGGVTYGEDHHRYKVFKGIGKQAHVADDLDAAPISSEDYLPPNG